MAPQAPGHMKIDQGVEITLPEGRRGDQNIPQDAPREAEITHQEERKGAPTIPQEGMIMQEATEI